mmetsp:Transcript_1150/g.1923  ORF Transcript_1150/g.1923 Transcript_1150/m.1923 type:complete len:85 (-) Transcript_1150:141-395(-)
MSINLARTLEKYWSTSCFRKGAAGSAVAAARHANVVAGWLAAVSLSRPMAGAYEPLAEVSAEGREKISGRAAAPSLGLWLWPYR